MKRQSFMSSVLREEWDHDTRLYRQWDAGGVLLESRTFTLAENTEADTRAAFALLESNEAAITANLGGSAVFDNLRTVAAGSGTFATAAIQAAAIRTCARGIVLLARLMLRRFDASD